MLGLVGYRTEWWHEFPLSLYMQLVDVYDGTKKLIPMEQVVNGPLNLGNNYTKTEFATECSIIQSLLEK